MAKEKDPRVIRTNDGWMTFLVITLILLTSTFYTMYYLNLKAQDYINPSSFNDGKMDSYDYFEEKERIQQDEDDDSNSGPKDLKTLLEEKRKQSNDASNDVRPNLDSTKDQMNVEFMEESEFKPSDIMEDSFYVVNHIFTYDNVFKTDDSGEAEFVPGSTAYLFVEMYNLQEDSNGEIDLSIDFKLQDDKSITLPGYDAEGLVVFKGKPPYKEGYFLARMSIPLKEDFTPGKYYTELVIKDKVSGLTKKEKWVIRIKEPTL